MNGFTRNALGREASGCQYFSQMLSPEGTHTMKTGNKTPGLTTPGQFLGYSLQARTAFPDFQYFTLHSSDWISDLKFAETALRPHRSHKFIHMQGNLSMDITTTAFKQALSRCYSNVLPAVQI